MDVKNEIVVYYSTNTGHTKSYVQGLGKQSSEVTTETKVPNSQVLKLIICGYKSVFKRKFGYQLQVKLEDYDKITICGPIWAGKLANPIDELIKENQELLAHKEVEIVATCDGNSGSTKDKLQLLLPNSQFKEVVNPKDK